LQPTLAYRQVMNVWELLYLPGIADAPGRVEAELRQAVVCPEPLLSEVASHLATAGGKQLRPALALASAAAVGGAVTLDVVRGAVAVELVHLGSLYHDDVIDEAVTRRGVDSVNARWGNLVAILAGDFLLARASEIAAELGAEVVRSLAATIGSLCQGEMAQLQRSYSVARTEAEYFAAISSKTASLLSVSTRIGALVGGATADEVEALTSFGHAFGMAFQIWDDVRDLMCTDTELGKPAGHDIVEGTYTLPVILALADPATGTELAALLGRAMDRPDVDKARDMILATDAVSASIGEARKWADLAAGTIEALGSGLVAPSALPGTAVPARQALAGLAHRLLDDLAVHPC